MRTDEVIKTSPINTELTVRGDEIRGLTSGFAGKCIPLAYFPILREDRVTRGSIRVSLDMEETVKNLMNAVNVTCYAHIIPFLAFERFNGSMETLNRAYQGIGEPHNGVPVPFFKTMTFNRQDSIWRALGIHWRNGTQINDAVVEAYNTLANFRRKARSEELPMRNLLDTTLAAAFWKNPAMSHIVPHFNQASMDGEVELQFATSRLGISGLGARVGGSVDGAAQARLSAGMGGVQTFNNSVNGDDVMLRTTSGGTPEVFAELADAGVRLSLANIELAKQTAAFAKLREKYSGLDDEHIIDLLMEGIRVPDEAMKQPILLDRKSTIFGYSERHAMDGASLDMSVTTGSTSLELTFRTPPMNTGGIILITCEIVPEQMYERQHDHFLGVTSADQLPNFQNDFLDPEKVDIVPNKFVDIEHANPEGIFGYAPLNHVWKRSFARIGGKYLRQFPDTFVEDRLRFWSVEQLNPTLTADFYMCPALPHSVFLDTVSPPFEIMTIGSVTIAGRTVFGQTLEEDTQDYEKIMMQVDKTRIEQE